MDSRERSARDSSLGFSSNKSILARMRAAALAQQQSPPAREPEAAERPTQPQPAAPPAPSPAAAFVDSVSSLPSWVTARATVDLPLFDGPAAVGPSPRTLLEGSMIRIVLPVVADSEGGQWALVQGMTSELGDLSTGYAQVADADNYWIDDLAL